MPRNSTSYLPRGFSLELDLYSRTYRVCDAEGQLRLCMPAEVWEDLGPTKVLELLMDPPKYRPLPRSTCAGCGAPLTSHVCDYCRRHAD